MKLNYKASFIYKMLLILSRQNHAVIAYICYNKLIIKSERMINLKKGEITISFSNHTFHLNLNEGESIDIRLKNDDGNIYMGQDTTSASEKVNDEERNERDNTSKEKTSSIVHRYMPLEDDEDEE